MKLLIGAGEGLHARPPQSALPERALHFEQNLKGLGAAEALLGGGLGALLGQLHERLGASLGDSASQRTGQYLAQFHRSAAELLMEVKRDAAALKELDAYSAAR